MKQQTLTGFEKYGKTMLTCRAIYGTRRP